MLTKEHGRLYYLKLVHDQKCGWAAVLPRSILRFCSWIYGLIVRGMRWAYQRRLLKSYQLGRPVISVGNVTWGGVGKTPLVELIVEMLWNSGKKPVVLIRGYMPGKKELREAISDEAQVLNQAFNGRVPVIVNRDRVQGALNVPANYAHDIFVLDDGFQQWRIRRDLNIVAIDSLNPFGNYSLIPRGILREPLTALKYADLIVLMKADLGSGHLYRVKQELKRFCPRAGIVEAVHEAENFFDLRSRKQRGLAELSGEKVMLVSGIGTPQAFEHTAKETGLNVQEHFIYPDHHCYRQEDVRKIAGQMTELGISVLVMTAKDAVKLDDELLKLFPAEALLFVLKVKVRIIEGEKIFSDAIHHLYNH
ncbi:MAG: tetraacyldisaccharide 4'-kinase [Candidatus Omnitrophota bacterium]